MFSGIVEASCAVVRCEDHSEGESASRRLVLDLTPLLGAGRRGGTAAGRRVGTSDAAASAEMASEGGPGGLDLRPGDSVAVQGCCLTVAEVLPPGERGLLRVHDTAFDVIAETLRVTTLGGVAPGDRLHVERSLRFGDTVDGHLVSGHVECTAPVQALEELPGETRLTILCGEAFAARCLPKGSIALDGVSLTIAELGADRLTVALVPHTLERTTLGERRPGDRVNLEADLLGRWALRAADLALSRAGRSRQVLP